SPTPTGRSGWSCRSRPAERQMASRVSSPTGISETIDDPEAIYDPKMWDASGFALVLSWLAQKWNQRCLKLAPRGSKNPEQYLTKEEEKAYLDSDAAELIPEITQGQSLNYVIWLGPLTRSKRSCDASSEDRL